MVVDWEQETGLLMSSGDVRIVRIWDTDRETKVQVTTPGPAQTHASPRYNCMLLLTKQIPPSADSDCCSAICVREGR